MMTRSPRLSVELFTRDYDILYPQGVHFEAQWLQPAFSDALSVTACS
jgi:hypothetical protein